MVLLLAWVLASAGIAGGLADSLLPAGGASRKRALLALLSYAGLAWVLAEGLALRPAFRRRALAALAGGALALIAFDLSARWLELPLGLPRVGSMGMSSRLLHHRYPANQTLRLGTGSGDEFTIRTNADGLRTSYDRATFRGRAPRIALLGDSFVFGLGVRQGTELPVLLERRLRAETTYQDAAVLNAGVVSYSPFLERLLFDDVVRAYEPQLVLLFLDVTDIGDDLKYEAESTGGDGRPLFELGLAQAEDFRDLGPLWNLSASWRKCLSLPRDVLARLWGSGAARPGYGYYRFDLELEGVRETNQYFLYRHPLEVTRPYFERTLRNVRQLAEHVAAAGSLFCVVVLPRYHHWNVAECPGNWERASYALDEPYQYEYFRYFREAAAAVDFPLLDLLPAFQGTAEFPLVLDADPHWNERGHAFVARQIADYLQTSGLLEAASRR